MLLGVFSLVTLLAPQQVVQHKLVVRQAAWYPKQRPTFAAALASVRRQVWTTIYFGMSVGEGDVQKLQHKVLEQLTETLCYAA